MRIVFIDDDLDSVRQRKEWGEMKKYDVTVVDNAFEANKLSADYFVFDLSAIGSLLYPHMMYSPICSLVETHPGSSIIVLSAASRSLVEDVMKEVREHVGSDVRIVYGGTGILTELEEALSQC